MDYATEQVIVDIIKTSMNLPNEAVWIGDVNRKIPNDKGLYVTVRMIDSVPVSSSLPYLKEVVVIESPRTVEIREVNEVQLSQRIQVDIYSNSNDAILRNWEVIAALGSIYAQQKQEANNFKIGRLPNSFINTSYAEGGSQLSRYTLVFSCLSWFRKETALSTIGGEFYDSFDTRVDDEKTIGNEEGLIEFTINRDTSGEIVTFENIPVTYRGEIVYYIEN